MPLADEVAWFKRNRDTIMQQYYGQWVLIKNSGVKGAFKTYEAAFTAGVQQFGPNGQFAVKQAVPPDPEELV